MKFNTNSIIQKYLLKKKNKTENATQTKPTNKKMFINPKENLVPSKS